MRFWRRGRSSGVLPAVLVVLLAALASSAPAQIPEDRLIIPGERIGRFRLHMLAREAATVLGGPGERRRYDSILSRLLGFTPLEKSYGLWWQDRGIFMLFSPAEDRATGIVLFDHPENRAYRTFEGVGIGSPLPELNRFAGPDGGESGGGTAGPEGKYIYWTLGLYVHWQDNRITAIGVLDNSVR